MFEIWRKHKIQLANDMIESCFVSLNKDKMEKFSISSQDHFDKKKCEFETNSIGK